MTAPEIARRDHLTEGELKHRYEAHVAMLGGDGEMPAYHELSHTHWQLWRAIQELNHDDLGLAVRSIIEQEGGK